ncbi:LysE family translocator [Breoghania sp. L-A4]|uniref:LysE family translocator n=1 Tax=Breoghania sp. L-A4 TaxID=2304600 RepID=UPI000E35D40F|nr:LysE family translocator [Breoghania sp. L-A4]AXS40376.1 LysE family translocator [Breoghania sp. L-A4]
MPDLATLAIFAGASVLCALEPGPNFLLLASETLRGDRLSGWKTAFGLHLGAWPHIALAAFGLSVVVQVVPEVLTALKWAAAAWLLWLAYRTVATGDDARAGTETLRNMGATRRGFALVLFNPRTSVFFAGFPLLFVSRDGAFAPQTQILLLGAVTNMIFLAVDLAFVAIVAKAGSLDALKASRRRWFRWIGGGLLAGLAVKLVVERD